MTITIQVAFSMMWICADYIQIHNFCEVHYKNDTGHQLPSSCINQELASSRGSLFSGKLRVFYTKCVTQPLEVTCCIEVRMQKGERLCEGTDQKLAWIVHCSIVACIIDR